MSERSVADIRGEIAAERQRLNDDLAIWLDARGDHVFASLFEGEHGGLEITLAEGALTARHGPSGRLGTSPRI